MAAIDPRFDKDGNRIGWQVRVRKRGHPAQTRTWRTKAEAQAWARQVENEMDRGVFVSRKEAEKPSLAEALDRYTKEVSARKKGAVQEQSIINKLSESTLAERAESYAGGHHHGTQDAANVEALYAFESGRSGENAGVNSVLGLEAVW